MSRFFRRASLCLLTLGLLALPAAANAARTWQSEEVLPPSTYTFNSGDSNSRYFQLDASGNALLAMANSGGSYRWAYRSHGGPLSAATAFPGDSVVGYNGQAQFSLDGTGNALAWTGGWYGDVFRPAGAGQAFGNHETLVGMTIYDIATAAGGESYAFLRRNADGHGLIAFRGAGPSATIDTAGATDIAPNGGDSGVTPLVVAIDADGGGAAVYRSTNSSATMVTTLPGGGGHVWSTPTELTGAPGGSGVIADSASDGTTAVIFASTSAIWASVRAPGGSFSAPTQVIVAAPGDEIGIYPRVVAVAGGHGVIAIDYRTPTCSGSSADQGWRAFGFNGTNWSSIAGGASVWPSSSGIDGLDASGSTVALTAHSSVDGDLLQCNNAIGGPLQADVAIGSGATLGATQTVATNVTTGNRFVAAGPSGDVLVGYVRNGTYDEALRAFEDRLAPPGDGGNNGSQNPLIVPPSKVTLKGTITVRKKAVKLPLQCQATYECYLLVTLFKVNPKDGAVVAAKPKALAKAKATIAAGGKKTLTLKLPKSVINELKRARGHKRSYYLQTQTTAGGKIVKVTQKRSFKLN